MWHTNVERKTSKYFSLHWFLHHFRSFPSPSFFLSHTHTNGMKREKCGRLFGRWQVIKDQFIFITCNTPSIRCNFEMSRYHLRSFSSCLIILTKHIQLNWATQWLGIDRRAKNEFRNFEKDTLARYVQHGNGNTISMMEHGNIDKGIIS